MKKLRANLIYYAGEQEQKALAFANARVKLPLRSWILMDSDGLLLVSCPIKAGDRDILYKMLINDEIRSYEIITMGRKK